MSKRWPEYCLEQENGAYVARCIEVDVTSDGSMALEAVANLQEALALYGEDEGWEPMLIPCHRRPRQRQSWVDRRHSCWPGDPVAAMCGRFALNHLLWRCAGNQIQTFWCPTEFSCYDNTNPVRCPKKPDIAYQRG